MRTIKLKSILSRRKKVNIFRSRKKSVKFKKKIVVEFPIPRSGKSKPVKRKVKLNSSKPPEQKSEIKIHNRRSSRFSRKTKPSVIKSFPILRKKY